MTRQQALLLAIEELQKNGENEQAATILTEIYDEMPLVRWSKKSILDAFQQYLNDNNNVFPLKSYLGKSLPTYKVIKRFFGSNSITDFKETFFPESNIYKSYYCPYSNYTLEDLKKCFIENYNNINNGNYVTYRQYNLYRIHGTPSLQFLLKKFNCKSYYDLLIIMDLKKPIKSKSFVVSSNKKILYIPEEIKSTLWNTTKK